MPNSPLPRIVVVGGGAGGLELVSRLGDTLGRRKRAEILLIDAKLTHLWKPLLHEVAAGTLDSQEDDVDYLLQAHRHHFDFRLGRLQGIDRGRKQIHLAATLDKDGRIVIPERQIPYDILVIAVGSVTNDFGTPGVREHCRFLDNREQADEFQHWLLENFLRAQTQVEPLRKGQLNVAIVGGGATGVELAAELHHTTRQLVAFGLDRIVPEKDVKISIVEAGPRILAALPERVAQDAEQQLRRLNVEIHTGKRVTHADADGLRTADGMFFPAEIKVWAAGIKAPDFLKDFGGLETNRLNQLAVRQTLQATRDDDIFAFGDCASCPRPGSDRPVPPTAQAASQQAAFLYKTLRRQIKGKSLPNFVYRNRGALVSFSEYSAIGNLMGNLLGTVQFEGRIARLAYRSLYRGHQRALFGSVRTTLLMLADFLTRSIRPRLKLH